MSSQVQNSPSNDMTIVLTCPACEHSLQLAPKHIGLEGFCVKCQAGIKGIEISPGVYKAVLVNSQVEIIKEETPKPASTNFAFSKLKDLSEASDKQHPKDERSKWGFSQLAEHSNPDSPQKLETEAEQPKQVNEGKIENPQPSFADSSALIGEQVEDSPFPSNSKENETKQTSSIFQSSPMQKIKSPFNLDDVDEDEPDLSAPSGQDSQFISPFPNEDETNQPSATDSSNQNSPNTTRQQDPLTFSTSVKLKQPKTKKPPISTATMVWIVAACVLVIGTVVTIITPAEKKAEYKESVLEFLEPGSVVFEKLPFGIGAKYTESNEKRKAALQPNPSQVSIESEEVISVNNSALK